MTRQPPEYKDENDMTADDWKALYLVMQLAKQV